MTATSAKIGYGTVFQTDYTLASPTVWVTLAETNGLSLPPISRDAVDASHESMTDEWRSFVTGLKSGGEISVSMNFIGAQYNTLAGEFNNTASRPRRILFASGTYCYFNATLLSLEVPVAPGERITATAKFKVDGDPGILINP